MALMSFALMWHGYHRRQQGYWLAYGVVIACSMYLHLFTVFVLAAQIVVLVVWLCFDRRLFERPTRRTVLGALAVVGIIVVLALPLISDWIWPLGSQLLAKLLGHLPEHQPLRQPPVFRFSTALVARVVREMLVWRTPFPAIRDLLLGLAAIGAVFGWRRSARSTATDLLSLLVSPLPIALFSHASSTDFGTRRLLFLLPFLLVLIALGVAIVADGSHRLLRRRGRPLVPVWRTTIAVVLLVTVPIAASATCYYYG
jgi:uncharacterized membrane protein